MLPSDLTLALWSSVLQAILALELHATGQMSMADFNKHIDITRKLLVEIDKLIEQERKAQEE